MTYLSSSATISRGVNERTAVAVRSGKKIAISDFFDREIRVRINADVGGDGHRLGGNLLRVELTVPRQRSGRGKRKRPARSDRHDAIVGLDEIARPGQDERRALVGDDEHRLEAAEETIAAPVARELDGGAFEVAAILFELGLEAGEQREGVRGRAREAGENRIVVEPADLFRVLLQDGVAEGNLPVTRHDRAVVVPDRQDRRRVDHSGQYASK